MAAMGEWGLAWWLFRDGAGLLRREDFRGQFDGSAFYRLAQRNGVQYFPGAGAEGARGQETPLVQKKMQ
jgi:hypothetical protein